MRYLQFSDKIFPFKSIGRMFRARAKVENVRLWQVEKYVDNSELGKMEIWKQRKGFGSVSLRVAGEPTNCPVDSHYNWRSKLFEKSRKTFVYL